MTVQPSSHLAIPMRSSSETSGGLAAAFLELDAFGAPFDPLAATAIMIMRSRTPPPTPPMSRGVFDFFRAGGIPRVVPPGSGRTIRLAGRWGKRVEGDFFIAGGGTRVGGR